MSYELFWTIFSQNSSTAEVGASLQTNHVWEQ